MRAGIAARPSVSSRRVLVVGAGPAGLAAARFLRELGREVLILEAGSGYGGIWAREPTNDVVYDKLLTNLPKVCMQSFDLDFPEHLPSYLPAEAVGEYVCTYADAFSLQSSTSFNSRLTQLRPLQHCGNAAWAGGQWRATWAVDGTAHEEDFDAAVVAVGHYEVPFVPEIPGQHAWLDAAPCVRRVMHARHYKNADSFAGRSVLVVGGRSSGVDINREVHGVASWLYSLEKSCARPSTEGRVTHVPLGGELAHDGHVYFQGECLPGAPVHDLILATGYTYSFPFLDEKKLGLDLGPARRYIAPLYQHLIHCRWPTLCFIGIPMSVPTPIPLFEAQGRFVAAHLSGSIISTQEEREAWVAKRREAVGARTQDMHFMSDDSWPYLKELTRHSGLSGIAYEAYCRRVDIVASIYRDRVRRRPKSLWADDSFRRCEYTVDWSGGTWTVQFPE